MAMSDDPAGRALAQLAAIVAASDDSIVSVTPEGLVATWNAGAERGYGYSAQEMVGRPVNVLAPHDRVEEADQLLARALRGESVRGFETVRVCKDGCSIPVSLTLSPIRDVSGAVAGVSTIAHDISAQKRMENQLRAKNEELARQNRRVEEANRAKNEFLANMSHELRSPLNGIIGFAELMHDGKLGPVSDQHKEYLGDILSSGKHLLQQVRDETHRFALAYHRTLRGKAGLRSALDDVLGIGPRRKRQLLQRFGSLARLRAASVEDLTRMGGLPPQVAEATHRMLNANSGP